jgi:hypothetical protein
MTQTRTQVLRQRLLALRDTLRRHGARCLQSLRASLPCSTQELPEERHPTPTRATHSAIDELVARLEEEVYAAQWAISWAADADPPRPAAPAPRDPEPQQPRQRARSNTLTRQPLRRSGAVRRRTRAVSDPVPPSPLSPPSLSLDTSTPRPRSSSNPRSPERSSSWRADYSVWQHYRAQSQSLQSLPLRNPAPSQDPLRDREEEEEADQLSPLVESPVSYRRRAGSSPLQFRTWRASRDRRRRRRSLSPSSLHLDPPPVSSRQARPALRLSFSSQTQPSLQSYRGRVFAEPEPVRWTRGKERRARESR